VLLDWRSLYRVLWRLYSSFIQNVSKCLFPARCAMIACIKACASSLRWTADAAIDLLEIFADAKRGKLFFLEMEGAIFRPERKARSVANFFGSSGRISVSIRMHQYLTKREREREREREVSRAVSHPIGSLEVHQEIAASIMICLAIVRLIS